MALPAIFRLSARFRAMRRLSGETRGSQLLELALALSILLVVVIGITDFGTAFLLRQRLAGAAMDGARVASVQSMGGLYGNPAPQSILDARTAVTSALSQAGVPTCGLESAVPNETQTGTLTYAFTASCAAGTATLVITRGATWTSTSVLVEGTQIQLTYPMTWILNQVLSGAALPLPPSITVQVQQSNQT